MLVSFAQSHFVAKHYFLPKLFLYTAMIFGWAEEIQENSQQHESFQKPNQKYLSNHVWSHALKQAPAATIKRRLWRFCHSFAFPTYPLVATFNLIQSGRS